MKSKDKHFVIFFVLMLAISIYVFQSSIPSAYSQSKSSSDDPSLHNNFLTYYNPYTMIKIQYPSFWKVSEVLDNNLVSFISPLETTAVIVQNMPTPSQSADEVLMNMLVKIKNNLPNVDITNTNISNTDNGSTIQTLVFTYGDDLHPSTYKVLQLLKTYKDETYIFTYQSAESLFDRFFPLVSQMYNSYQVPSFENIFPTDIYATDSEFTKDTSDQTMNQQDRFLTYSNKTLGLEIQYPSGMNKTEKDTGVEFMFSNNHAGAILATSNIDSTATDNYVTSHLSYLNKSLDNLHILNTSRSDVMGYPTAKILFTYQNGTELYKGLQFWNIKDERARLFTYFAPINGVFDEFLPTIEKMLTTIKVS